MIQIVYSNDNQDGDMSTSATSGTATSDALSTAVILSLLVDARADDGDDIPSGTDRRGWWAEAFFDELDTWGSKIWIAMLQKATSGALRDVKDAADAALRWMIDDRVCRAIETETWWLEGRQGYMGLLVRAYRYGSESPEYIGPFEIFWKDRIQ